jgi:hypothetical protein
MCTAAENRQRQDPGVGSISRLLAVLLSVSLCACAAAPRTRPVKMGDVDTGVGSLEDTRRQLAGTWTLVEYRVYDKGTPVRVEASAELSYDEFSNLKMKGAVKDPAQPKSSTAVLNYEGRASIDIRRHQLRLLDLQGAGQVPESLEENVSFDAVRRYDIQGTRLTLTVLGEGGATTAVSVWDKRP